MKTFLGGHRKLCVDTSKEFFGEVDSGVGTHEVIYVASNYQNILGGVCLKSVDIIVYYMLDETLGGEEQVEYCITIEAVRFSSLHPTTDLHDIAVIGGRFYPDVTEAGLEPGNEWGSQPIVTLSEEALKVFWKSLLTSVIPMMGWYVAAMAIISQSVGSVRTGE